VDTADGSRAVVPLLAPNSVRETREGSKRCAPSVWDYPSITSGRRSSLIMRPMSGLALQRLDASDRGYPRQIITGTSTSVKPYFTAQIRRSKRLVIVTSSVVAHLESTFDRISA
jgi:hypothetical protein